MASGSTPLFISQPRPTPTATAAQTLSPGLATAVVRDVLLTDGAGRTVASARVSCRLTCYGAQVCV